MKEQKFYCDKIIKIEMLSYIEGATKLKSILAPLIKTYILLYNLIILSQIELLLRKNNISLPSKTMNIMYENLKNKGNNFIILSQH